MKILKPGREQTGYTVEAKCTGGGNGGGGCGALLLVEQDDMRYLPATGGDSWGSRDAQVMFRCIGCGVITNVKEREWPPQHDRLARFTNQWRDGGK